MVLVLVILSATLPRPAIRGLRPRGQGRGDADDVLAPLEILRVVAEEPRRGGAESEGVRESLMISPT